MICNKDGCSAKTNNGQTLCKEHTVMSNIVQICAGCGERMDSNDNRGFVCKKCVAEQPEYLSNNFIPSKELLTANKENVFKCANKNCDFYGCPEKSNYCSVCFSNLCKDAKPVANFTSNLQKQNLLPMPKNYDRMHTEAKQLGLTFLGHIDKMSPRQKLISYMHQSDNANRSPFKTTCMIFGQSGVGKTSFINHLIGDNLLKTSGVTSETRYIQEIILTMKEPSLNVSDLQLTFVDTPGYFDDKGDKQDKKNFTALNEYKQEHFSEIYPNLIFIVIQGTDNRFLNGPLVKFLKKLKKLELVCPSNPNVICLFTYASVFLNDSEENIERKKAMLIDLCYEKLGVTVSVAYIENNCNNLQRTGDWTELMDGTLQPINVFECAKRLMKGNHYKPDGLKYIDPLGIKTLGSFFKEGASEHVKCKVNVIHVNDGICDDSMSQSCSGESGDADILGEVSVGKGYDVLNDEIKETSIFDFQEQEKLKRFNVNKGFDITNIGKKDSFFLGADMESSITQRLDAIGLGDKIEAKYVLSKTNYLNDSVKSKLLYLHEIRTYKLYIPDTSKLNLNKTFVEAVMSDDFPSSYVSSKPNIMQFFEKFFNRWGHYVVTSAYLGGCIELKSNFTNQKDEESVKNQLKCGLTILKHGIQESQERGEILDNLSLIDIELNWIGGAPKPQVLNLKNIETASSPYKSWKDSLNSKPSVLKTVMKLESIADFVSRLNKEKGEACQTASEHLLGISKPRRITMRSFTKGSVNIPATRNSAANDAEPDTNSCFSGNGKIIVMKNYPETKSLKELNVGDKVLSFETKTKELVYSRVYMIAHKNDTKKISFLKITCKNGISVTLSPKHLVYTKSYKVKHADQIKIGDGLWTTSIGDSEAMSYCEVDSIEVINSVGFYAPLTMSGNIIVDGVLSSCYANVMDVSLPGFGSISGQCIAHFGTAPLRIAYFIFQKKLQCDEEMPRCIANLYQFGKRANLVSRP